VCTHTYIILFGFKRNSLLTIQEKIKVQKEEEPTMAQEEAKEESDFGRFKRKKLNERSLWRLCYLMILKSTPVLSLVLI